MTRAPRRRHPHEAPDSLPESARRTRCRRWVDVVAAVGGRSRAWVGRLFSSPNPMTTPVPAVPVLRPKTPHFRRAELRVKIRSLAAEATIIRQEEVRAKRQRREMPEKYNEARVALHNRFWSLRGHRYGLSYDARVALLAYGFLRGRPYRRIECRVLPTNQLSSEAIREIFATVHRFGRAEITLPEIEAWLKEPMPELPMPDPLLL